MRPPCKGTSSSVDLDFLRGLAAVLVTFGHARLLMIFDTNMLDYPLPLWAKPFYFLTNLGSSAVMVFFVMSGFLIGSSVFEDVRLGGFSWRRYGVARLSRIYTVLVPALVSGMVFDLIGGSMFANSIVYSTPHYGVMLPDSVSNAISPAIVMGNLLNTQKIFVPTLGSNNPLWSLANEFWYYVAFPFLVLSAVNGVPVLKRVINIVLFSFVVFWLLTPAIRGLFIVWLLGASLSFVPSVRVHRWQTMLVGLTLVGWLALQSLRIFAHPYVTGLISTFLIYCIVNQATRRMSSFYDRFARGLSAISYTLYLTHTPLIVFLAAVILRTGPKLNPDLNGMLLTLVLVGSALAYATLIWFLFERQTHTVKNWLAYVVKPPKGLRRV